MYRKLPSSIRIITAHAPSNTPVIRARRPIKLPIPILELLRQKESITDWHQLLRPGQPIERMHQRRDSNVDFLEQGLWLSSGGYGDFDG